MAIVVLQTTTFGSHGGIQTYNRLFARALNSFGDLGEIYVLVMTDHASDVDALRELDSYQRLRIETFGGKRSAFVRRVFRLACQVRIDLLLVGHVNYAPLGMFVRRLQPRLRYGISAHGNDAWLNLSRIRRRALRKADFIMSVSEDTYRRAESVNGHIEGRPYILPNALPWAEDSIVCDSSPKGTNLLMLSVGRLAADEGQKGVDTVIEALPRIRVRVPNIRYVVIGEGSDLDRHRNLAHRLGVAAHVNFLGSVDEATLRRYYKACDLFVLPSAQEGFGIVFLEAMHYKKPIIAANKGGTPEVVKDRETGMLVEYGNVEQLTAAITALCTNQPERDRMGDAGYKRLQENFTFDHFKRRLHEIVMAELPQKAFDHGERQVARRASSLT